MPYRVYFKTSVIDYRNDEHSGQLPNHLIQNGYVIP